MLCKSNFDALPQIDIEIIYLNAKRTDAGFWILDAGNAPIAFVKIQHQESGIKDQVS